MTCFVLPSVQHVQLLHKDGDIGFSKEYEAIHAAVPPESLPAEQSEHPDNKPKNRYLNIVACECSAFACECCVVHQDSVRSPVSVVLSPVRGAVACECGAGACSVVQAPVSMVQAPVVWCRRL